MTLLVPHLIDAVSTDADALRRALQTVSPGQVSAVLGTNDLKVTTSGGMVSVIAAGKGLAFNSQNTVSGGAYAVANDANVSLTHSASDPTNPRNDLVGVKIEDAFYSGTNKQATPTIVTGTPAASPVDPATPANWLPLARVRVNAGASTLGTITDLRSFVWQTILAGGLGFHVRDSTNAFDNLGMTDAGLVTLRNTIVIPPSAGGTPAPTSYGSLAIKYDEQMPSSGSSLSIPASGSFPGGYRHIRVRWKARTNSANATDTISLRMNNDSGANSYRTEFAKVDSGTASATEVQAGSVQLGNVPGGAAAAGLFASGWFEIPSAFDVNNKTFYGATTGGDAVLRLWSFGAVWFATAAITVLTAILSAGAFVSGSGFWTELIP